MAESLRQRLAQRRRRIEWIVHSLEQTRCDAPGHGQVLAQEALGLEQQIECVAVKLPVVEELGAVGAAELCHAQQALWNLGLQALGATKQHHCRTQYALLTQQPQAAQ